MQNTSPGPEGKEREGRSGEGRQRTEYEWRHFPPWPIVYSVSALQERGAVGDTPGGADKLGVYRAFPQASRGCVHSQH